MEALLWRLRQAVGTGFCRCQILRRGLACGDRFLPDLKLREGLVAGKRGIPSQLSALPRERSAENRPDIVAHALFLQRIIP
jgi:hypothetical protein